MKKIVLCLVAVSLAGYSYAADGEKENASSYQDKYPITCKVLQAFFSNPKKETTAAGTIERVATDGVTIQLHADTETDIQVKLQVDVFAKGTEEYAPWQRSNSLNLKIQAAYMTVLQKNMSFGQWIQYQLGMGVDRATLAKKYWVDDAMQCKASGSYITCNIQAQREMFEAIKANTQAAPKPCAAQSQTQEKITSSNADPKFRFPERMRPKANPAQNSICNIFIQHLLKSNEYTKSEDGNNIILSFEVQKDSPKMKGYTCDKIAADAQKYGADKIPSHITTICKDDMQCLTTWFAWWHLQHANAATGQYYLDNNCELYIQLGCGNSDYSGYVSIPKEMFESMQK